MPFFARFRPFSAQLAPGPAEGEEPAAGTQNQGPGARAGRQRRPRRPVAAAAPRGPPGPERRRRERRGEPRRPGAREPGAERPPGGQPGRSGQRGSASTVEGTAGPGRRDRLPRTPGGPDRRRGGRRVGVAARAASGRAARRPTAREKGPGREPARAAAYRDSRRPRPARGRGEPLGAPRPERSAGSGGGSRRRAPGPRAAVRSGGAGYGALQCVAACVHSDLGGGFMPPFGGIRGRGNIAPDRGHFPCARASTQGHPPGVRRAGAVHPGDGASHQQDPIIGPPLNSIRPRR